MTTSVTGITAEKAASIEAATVIWAFVSDAGDLILEMQAGTQINAGPIAEDLRATDPSLVTMPSPGNSNVQNQVLIQEFLRTELDQPAKLANPATLPAGNGNGVSFSPDGVYMAVASSSSPYITVYKRDEQTFTKLTDPGTLPTGAAQAVAWSPDGQFLAVAHFGSPYVTIYQRAGDVFTKLTNPGTLPTFDGYSIAWSPDGQYLVVGYGTSPYLAIYKRSGTTFTKLTDPASLPAATPNTVHFSHNGRYLVVGVNNTTDPFAVYTQAGDVFTKLSNPAIIPSSAFVNEAVFSPDDRFLALACSGTSKVFIYKRWTQDDTFVKLQDTNLGPGYTTQTIGTVAFSPDGKYLVAVASASPYVPVFFKWDEEAELYVQYGNYVSTFPTGAASNAEFSPDGKFMAVAHTTSPAVSIYPSFMGQLDDAYFVKIVPDP